MIDFLIVGRGLAANTLMHTFSRHGISFRVIGDETLSSCSTVAAGIWNPVVFKRMTKSWLADELIPSLNQFYQHCESLLQKKFITQRPIIKPFTEDQEKALWKKKAKAELEDFIEETIYSEPGAELSQCKIPNGYGSVNGSGNLNVAEFIASTSDYFKELITTEIFDHSGLSVFQDKIVYKELEAKRIVFCEGFMVKDNPFFKWIPLRPAKGEILTIEAPDLQLKNAILNRDGYLMDISDKLFKTGATYAWDDMEQHSTVKALEELDQKLQRMITCGYTVLKQEAGIRPSTIDRRPILGPHPVHPNLFVFNGMGTKGVMLAPYFAKNFVNFYLQKEALNEEVHIKRFYHLYDKKNQA